MAQRSQPPLLIEWSTKHVRVFDPATHLFSVGSTVSECLTEPQVGRGAIVGVSQRSAFIRSLELPKASRDETSKILKNQMGGLLPLDPGEYVFGFRMGPETSSKGRLVVVGAIKTETLRSIHKEAEACGLDVEAVVPVAFGSWLMARERAIHDCLVIESDDVAVNLAVIHDGELCYCRSIPGPESPEGWQDEVARTFTIAGVGPSPVVSSGHPGVHVDLPCDKEAIQYLGVPNAIRQHLFTIELPEMGEARAARANRWRAQRAVAAAVAALALGGYAFVSRLPADQGSEAARAKANARLRTAQSQLSSARARLAKAETARRILDVAFRPGQTLSDVVAALAGSAPKASWFTNLTINRGAPISISGLAMSDRDVANFADAVSKDPRFDEMKVISSTKAFIGKRPVTQFLVLGKVRGLLAFDRPPKARKGR